MAAYIRNSQERRIIMVGKTGNGKSSTANTLLEYEGFETRQALKAVTTICKKRQTVNSKTGYKYIIVDTPGLFDAGSQLSKRALEIQRSVEICTNPHAFLLIFSGKSRLTEEELFTIDLLRVIFGEKVFEHFIVIFTHGEDFETESVFKKFWTESEQIVDLVQRCGNRVTTIENNFVEKDASPGDHILAMIEDMSKNGQKTYQYPWLHVHKKALEEHTNQYKGGSSVGNELAVLVQRLGKMLNKEVWKVMLIGGAVTGAAGLAGYGAFLAAPAVVAAASGAASTIVGVVGSGAVAVGGTVISAAWKLATNIRFR